MLTDRDIQIILAVIRYYVLDRHQVQRLFFPNDTSKRATRRRLQMLVSEHYLNRQSMLFCRPSAGAPSSVYYPARRGCELLAEHLEDERFLTVPAQAPVPHHIPHWLACSDTHIAFDQAINLQNDVQLVDWINEWDTVNKDEADPALRFRLYTVIRESPRLVCAPDAAFLLSMGNHTAIYYLEQDRATSGVNRVAASKTPGYVALAAQNLQRRHFHATVEGFRVLMVAPHPKRRDNLRKTIRGKPGADLWRFAAIEDMKPERVLFEPIWYPCEGDPVPLVKGVRNTINNLSEGGRGNE